ncbi:MAG TPA: L,D-transpeptidase family protein [Steroidobacteraceae bacterium]|nr:L,D-transpeptidase family protein [Steroidobacteraceae bacterium]
MMRLRPWRALPVVCAALLASFTCVAGNGLPTSMQHYALVEQALARYQQLARQPGLTDLPPLPGRSLRPGDSYRGLAALRNLLRAVGDLPATPASPPPTTSVAGGVEPAVLDAPTVAALKRFQERHGLSQDGVLGPATWRALTTPMSARVRQIELTLARWRSLPPNPHHRAIFINIPRFRLYAMNADDDREADLLQMDVVVGRVIEKLHTPVFSADLTHLIFRPYWDVPRSITMAEILPAVRKDPAYFQKNNFELVDRAGHALPWSADRLPALAAGELRVRQRPGDSNALGGVKFMLPNPYNVYLHDTPQRELFARTTRAFSHGCIRVAEPAALAHWLLADDAAWTPQHIAEAMQRSEPLQVELAEPVRVYIVYGTAIAREDGSVLFLNDLYGLDKD